MSSYDVLVVGAGIFGITAVLELQTRGHQTAVLDPGPIPHPDAASTDISKVIRMQYGADAQYMAMVEQAIHGWHAWNQQFGPLYHETGVTMFTKDPMAPGGFEYESWQMMQQRGHAGERLTTITIPDRFPAWKPGAFVDGFYHARGGYAESGRVVAALTQHTQALGATILSGQAAQELLISNGRITGIRTTSSQTIHAQHTVIAAGTWTPLLVPELAPLMKSTGHPVFHLRPAQPELFTPPNFTVFTADVARTGWYGFPVHPTEGVVKIANHGVGVRLHPSRDPRVVTADDERAIRAFLADTFPALLDAPIVYTRRCLYCDTLDEHLWIDRHPTLDGLTVAAGGSGHGFKFGPVLGSLTADAVEGKANDWLPKFAWRTLAPSTTGEEASRYHG